MLDAMKSIRKKIVKLQPISVINAGFAVLPKSFRHLFKVIQIFLACMFQSFNILIFFLQREC
jgi:hypothetical protein